MNALEKHAVNIRKQFAAVDTAIAELEAHKSKLTAQIDELSNDFSLEFVKSSAPLRAELAQVAEALERARARRQEMIADMPVSALSTAVRQSSEAVAAEYAAEIDEIWDLCTQLRQRVKALRKNDSEAREGLRRTIRELKPYYPAGTVESHSFPSPIIPLIKDYSDGNAAILRKIAESDE